jgi:hypothetical protein
MKFYLILLICVSLMMSKDDDLFDFPNLFWNHLHSFFTFTGVFVLFWMIWSMHLIFSLFFLPFIGYIYCKYPLISSLLFTTHEECLFACVFTGINTNPFLNGLNFMKTCIFKISPWKCPLCLSESHWALNQLHYFLDIEKTFYFHIGQQLQGMHFFGINTQCFWSLK